MTGALLCLDITVSAGTVTFATGTSPTLAVSGSMTLLTGTLWTSTGTITFNATTAGKTITTNGVLFPCSIQFNGAGGAWALGSALTIASTLVLVNGTLDLNGKTFTISPTATSSALTTSSGTKNLTFNGGTLLFTAASGILLIGFQNSIGFTTTAGTGTGVISFTGAALKSFSGGGATFNCTLNQGGAGDLTINGSNTFSDITNTYGAIAATAITFQVTTTTTVANFSAAGTPGKLLTLRSSSSGTRATLSKLSGGVNSSYLSIRDLSATGGAVWNAGPTSTDGGNNTGWRFATQNNLMFFF
jgi:hypothetical protein